MAMCMWRSLLWGSGGPSTRHCPKTCAAWGIVGRGLICFEMDHRLKLQTPASSSQNAHLVDFRILIDKTNTVFYIAASQPSEITCGLITGRGSWHQQVDPPSSICGAFAVFCYLLNLSTVTAFFHPTSTTTPSRVYSYLVYFDTNNLWYTLTDSTNLHAVCKHATNVSNHIDYTLDVYYILFFV